MPSYSLFGTNLNTFSNTGPKYIVLKLVISVVTIYFRSHKARLHNLKGRHQRSWQSCRRPSRIADPPVCDSDTLSTLSPSGVLSNAVAGWRIIAARRTPGVGVQRPSDRTLQMRAGHEAIHPAAKLAPTGRSRARFFAWPVEPVKDAETCAHVPWTSVP